MTLRKFILRSLRFHLRSHIGVISGAAIACAVLTGALIVGDSMRESLRERAIGKLGWIHYALASPDRLFNPSSIHLTINPDGSPVTDRALAITSPVVSSVPGTGRAMIITDLFGALNVPGTASRQDSAARANHVQIYGLPCYWQQNSDGAFPPMSSNSVIINAALASQLGARPGDEIILRCRKPSAISREIAVTPHAEQTVALRLKISRITAPGAMGDFSIQAEQTPPLNAFVRLDELSARVGEPNKVNLFAAGARPGTVRFRFEKNGILLRVESWLWHRSPQFAKQLGLGKIYRPSSHTTQADLTYENDVVRSFASLDFLGMSVRDLTNDHVAEARSSQIFLEPELVRAARAAFPADTNRCEILTLLANLIRHGTNTTPYSMVTAAGPPYTPSDLKDDEIILNQWLADDLHATVGARIALSYFDPESGAALREKTNLFRVHSIVPMQLPWADRTLMPAFPGIENAESTSDWDGGFPLKYKIRPKDEDYWKKFRGTPKAFVTLAAGQKMWGNRFGNLTSIRFLNIPESGQAAVIANQIWCRMNPNAFGLRFQPVREQALKGADQAQDFGQLFIGFSLFLVVAALLLMALLFQFGLERRASEVGILLALGFVPGKVRRLLLWEAALLALLGSIIGAAAAVLYADAMLHGLSTIWRDAVGGMTLQLHATAGTIAIGIISSVLVALITIWLTLRKQGKQPARELLAGHAAQESFGLKAAKRGWPFWTAAISLACGLATIGWAIGSGQRTDAEAFFSAACLLLIGGLCAVATWLRHLSALVPPDSGMRRSSGALASPETEAGEQPAILNSNYATGVSPSPSQDERAGERRASIPFSPNPLHLSTLAIRACARRRKRSISTVALFATGVFLIIAIGVFRLDANSDASKPTSGTGGFALIGQSTLPIVQDLNSPAGRDAFALSAQTMANTRVVQCRVRDGDEASCLNLDRPQRPRIIGVNPEALKGRFTFENNTHGEAWNLLKSPSQRSKFDSGSSHPQPRSIPNPLPSRLDSAPRSPLSAPALSPVPAIADANSLEWALRKNVGDTIDYTDDRGRTIQFRIVGAVANSILQGSLIIDEAEFLKLFPDETGYRMFLIDAPSNQVTEVSQQLTRALQDVGLELTSSTQRLNAFNAVQNTYLGTFQILGGLGLLLGSAGLAIVVLRNMLERRGELGLLTAIGFTRARLARMTLIEHGSLLAAGLGIGIVGAVIALLPAITTPGRSLPIFSLGLTLLAVVANGLLWTWLSTRIALRGNLLKSLRNE